MHLNHEQVRCPICTALISRPNRTTHREACERRLVGLVLALCASGHRLGMRLELREVTAEIDRAYWAFTRQVRGRLAPHATYVRRIQLRRALGLERCSPAEERA